MPPVTQGHGQKRPKRIKLPKAKTEPAIIRGVVVAALSVLAALGFDWADDVPKQTVTSVAIVLAFLAPIVTAVWTRFAVTPNAKVIARLSVSKGTAVAGDAATDPAGWELETERRAGATMVQPVTLRSDVFKPAPNNEPPQFS